MGVGVKVNVWGDYALFSRPELKVERYSYDIITPSAARGILEAIYWHPGMRWIIDKKWITWPIILKCNHDTEHWRIAKHCDQNKYWKHQQIQLAVFSFFNRRIFSFHFCFHTHTSLLQKAADKRFCSQRPCFYQIVN